VSPVIDAYLRDAAQRKGTLEAYEQWHVNVVEKKTMPAKVEDVQAKEAQLALALARAQAHIANLARQQDAERYTAEQLLSEVSLPCVQDS
jgi:hypothetical protein